LQQSCETIERSKICNFVLLVALLGLCIFCLRYVWPFDFAVPFIRAEGHRTCWDMSNSSLGTSLWIFYLCIYVNALHFTFNKLWPSFSSWGYRRWMNYKFSLLGFYLILLISIQNLELFGKVAWKILYLIFNTWKTC
jgi:hypothetical protein